MNPSGDAGADLAASCGASFTLDPRRTATSPAPAISSPGQHVRIPGSREPGVDLALPRAFLFPPLHPKSLHSPGWAPSSGRSARERTLRGCGMSSPVAPRRGGRHALPVFLQGQTAFLLGAPVLGTFGGVGGVGPSSWIEGNQHQSQGHELAQPLGTHGSWCKPPARRPGFFVLPSASSSSSAFPSSSHSSSRLAFPSLAAAALIEVTQRPSRSSPESM